MSPMRGRCAQQHPSGPLTAVSLRDPGDRTQDTHTHWLHFISGRQQSDSPRRWYKCHVISLVPGSAAKDPTDQADSQPPTELLGCQPTASDRPTDEQFRFFLFFFSQLFWRCPLMCTDDGHRFCSAVVWTTHVHAVCHSKTLSIISQ